MTYRDIVISPKAFDQLAMTMSEWMPTYVKHLYIYIYICATATVQIKIYIIYIYRERFIEGRNYMAIYMYIMCVWI